MRIVVCVKHSPDALSPREFAQFRLRRSAEDGLGELDEHAVEEAVSIAEAVDGEVIALSMGPSFAEATVRRALQMGAGRGVLVTDDQLEGTDVGGTAAVLAGAIRKIGAESPVDLVLMGMSSADAMTAMLPGALAQALGLPSLTLASVVRAEAGRVRIRRSIDGRDDVLSAPLPALISVTDQCNEPRYPGFQAIAAARSKPVDTWALADLDLDEAARARLGMAGSGWRLNSITPTPPRAGGDIFPAGPAAVGALVNLLKEATHA